MKGEENYEHRLRDRDEAEIMHIGEQQTRDRKERKIMDRGDWLETTKEIAEPITFHEYSLVMTIHD